MLSNKSQIIKAIKTVATALGDINDQVVYVGGSVVGLYADDPGAPDVRPTKDIDIVMEIASLLEVEKFRQKLAERGIHFAKDEDVMCRFKYQNILIDVMATKEVGWANQIHSNIENPCYKTSSFVVLLSFLHYI